MGSGGTQKVSNEPDRQTQKFRESLLSAGGRVLKDYSPEYYPFSSIAGPSPYTESAVKEMSSFGQSPFYSNTISGGIDNFNSLNAPIEQTSGEIAGNQLNDPTINNLTNRMNVTPGQNPYVQDLIQKTLQNNTKQFQEEVLPGVRRGSQNNNAFGGSRQQLAEGKALGDLADVNARTASQMALEGYRSDIDDINNASNASSNLIATGGDQTIGREGANTYRSSSGINALPTLLNAGTFGTNQKLNAGNIDQNFRQQVTDDDFNAYMYNQNVPIDLLNIYSGLLSGVPGGNIRSTKAPKGGTSGAIGGASTGLSLASSAGASGGWSAAAAILGGILGSQ